MAHVKSGSFSSDGGVYLYQTDKDGNPIRKIGGPYPNNWIADRESIRVSKKVGEGPIEEYIAELERGLMNEEEMRRMQMEQALMSSPARYVQGEQELREFPGKYERVNPAPSGRAMYDDDAMYNPNAPIVAEDQKRSLMQLIQNAKLQYDMLVSQGQIDPRVTPFNPMAIIAQGLFLEGSGMPGDQGGAFIPAVPDEQLPFDTNMRLDPLANQPDTTEAWRKRVWPNAY